MPEVKKELVDPIHAALRASCLKLKAYARDLAKTPKAVIRAAELETRLERALYPRDDGVRSEPLDQLLERERQYSVKEHRDVLTDTLEKVDRLRCDLEGPEHEKARTRLKGIADSVDEFLRRTV